MTSPITPRIAIIGAGPGGIAMAIKLIEAGYSDLTIYEKSDQLGGTWNHNRYPGCACDIQAELYSYSFEPNHAWTRPYPRQPEILAYFQRCADTYGLGPRFRFETELAKATWHHSNATWELEFGDGTHAEVDIVVSAIGMFNELAYPDIDGLEDFAGVSFHSARWNWDHDLGGREVAVIGSAASAVQFVPEIRKVARTVHLFQRTANWVLPKLDDPYTTAQLELHASDPSIMAERRSTIFHHTDNGTSFTDDKMRLAREQTVLGLLAEIRDPGTRAKLTPDHPWGCKRPLFSNDYYPAFNEPNLHLVTEPIASVEAGGVRTADGTLHPADTLVLATGFQTTKFLSSIDVRGRNGQHITDAWNDGAQAYAGVATSGFPNLFMLYGPNTNNGSLLAMIEYQIDNIVQHVRRMDDEDLAWVDVRPEAMERYNDMVQDDLTRITSWHAGCNSYYRAESGRIVTQWPNSMSALGAQLADIDPSAFESAHR